MCGVVFDQVIMVRLVSGPAAQHINPKHMEMLGIGLIVGAKIFQAAGSAMQQNQYRSTCLTCFQITGADPIDINPIQTMRGSKQVFPNAFIIIHSAP
ncbi:hypothetical protein D3C87_1571910 [compost metagenome]